MKKLKSLFKGIGYLIITLLVAITVYTFVQTQIMKSSYVNIFGYSFFSVKSGSMNGTIDVNDIVIVKVGHDIKENDIVTFFDSHDDIVTHRLIIKNGDSIVTQGDANNAQDEPMDIDRVIGKVVFIFSPNFFVKLVATIFIIIIFLLLINFDQIIKKFILVEEDENTSGYFDVLPEDVFSSPKKRGEEKSTGLTVTIPIADIEKMKKSQEVEVLDDDIEVLEMEELIDNDSNKIITKEKTSRKDREKELVELVISLLRIKNDSLKTAKINKKWLEKYQYVYKLTNIININDMVSLEDMIKHPTFKEIYDYDLDKIGLYENLRNRLYEMPIYIFLRILCYAILYNDEEFFDGVFKIMKYKILIDKNSTFRSVKKDDSFAKKQLKLLISFMQKIPDSYDNKNVFELEKIERLVKIKGYVSE